MNIKEINQEKNMIAEINKARLWEYLYHNPNKPTDVIIEALGFTTNQMMHYIRYMYLRKYVSRKKEKVNGISRYVYNVDKEYTTDHYTINKLNTSDIKGLSQDEAERAMQQTKEAHLVREATRVIKLLDNPLPKGDEPKRKTVVRIGSSMGLFNSY